MSLSDTQKQAKQIKSINFHLAASKGGFIGKLISLYKKVRLSLPLGLIETQIETLYTILDQKIETTESHLRSLQANQEKLSRQVEQVAHQIQTNNVQMQERINSLMKKLEHSTINNESSLSVTTTEQNQQRNG